MWHLLSRQRPNQLILPQCHGLGHGSAGLLRYEYSPSVNYRSLSESTRQTTVADARPARLTALLW